MLPRLTGYIFWLPALFGLGSLFFIPIRRRIEIPNDLGNLFVLTIGGIALLGTVANIANYFIPTGTIIPLTLLILGWSLFIFKYRMISGWVLPRERSNQILLAIVYVISLIITAYYAQRGLLNIDVGDYHFSAVRWTTNSRLPMGLANVNPYLAYNYLWFQAAAMMEVIPTGSYSAFILNGLLLSVFTTVVWYMLACGLRGHFTPSTIFMALCVLAWIVIFFLSPKEVYSFTPNLAVALLSIIAVFISLRALEQDQQNRLFYLYTDVLIVIIALLVKISTVVIVLLPIIVFVYWWRYADRKVSLIEMQKLLAVSIPAGLVLIIPWIPRGILTSGCVVYPISATCIESLPWSRSISDVQYEYTLTQSIGRMMNNFGV
jgi:hypothetical protein